MRPNTSVFTYGDYDIHHVKDGFILTEGGNAVDGPFESCLEAHQAMMEIENLELCETCDELWSHDVIPVCPVCNAHTLRAIDKVTALWHEHPHADGDVLDIHFGDDGRMIVKTWNLYQRDQS